MKILMACADWGIPLRGHAGSSVHFRCLANALTGLGHEVRLVVSNASGPAPCAHPVEAVPYRRFWPAVNGIVERLRGRSAPPDTVQSVPASGKAGSSPLPGAHAEISTPSWKTSLYYQKLPLHLDRIEELLFHRRSFGRAMARVLAEFSPDGVYERYALGQTGASWAARAAGPRSIPHLLEVNASLASERIERGELTGLWAGWSRLQEVRQWRRADGIFCVSGELRDKVVSAGSASGRVVVTPNGVDVDAFSPGRPKGALRRHLVAGEQDVLVGWLGSLSPGRGAEEFLRILALTLPLVPEARGVVIGDGNLAGELKLLAEKLGLAGRVVFLGAVPHADVPELLVDLDIAVASYPSSTGFYFSPMKVAEYLACGLAVVCGRAGQMRELVEDGISGILMEPGDLPAWGQAVAALCRDPGRRARIGQAARQVALKGPTWEKNARLVGDAVLALRNKGSRVGAS